MRAQVAKTADASDLGIRHPTIFAVEPSAQRTGVTVRASHAGDFSKVAFHNFILKKKVLRVRAHEVTSSEKQIRFLDRISHRHAFFAGDAQRLLDEHVLARSRGGE